MKPGESWADSKMSCTEGSSPSGSVIHRKSSQRGLALTLPLRVDPPGASRLQTGSTGGATGFSGHSKVCSANVSSLSWALEHSAACLPACCGECELEIAQLSGPKQGKSVSSNGQVSVL